MNADTRVLVEIIREIGDRLQEHNRRLAGATMRGKVTEVDPAKKIVRIEIGKDEDGNPVKSPWVPYKQTAGALKLHNPPSVGQVMGITAESGDVEQGVAEPYWWSDDNESPSDSGDEHKLTFGDVTITLSSGGLSLTVGGTTFDFTGGGFTQTGGRQEHDGKSVGADHRHADVVTGPDQTGLPTA